MTREQTPFTAGAARRAWLVLPTAVLIAACAAPGGGASSAPTAAPATPAPVTAAPATEPPMSAPPAAALTLQLAEDASLGSYVTGADGMALYIFTPDAKAPGTSTCNGQCADNWPPLTVAAPGDVAVGTGVTGSLGTVTRDDGSLQVTLGGNPLYYFVGDAAAGDVNGQGLNDVWYVATADGSGVDQPTSASEPRY